MQTSPAISIVLSSLHPSDIELWATLPTNMAAQIHPSLYPNAVVEVTYPLTTREMKYVARSTSKATVAAMLTIYDAVAIFSFPMRERAMPSMQRKSIQEKIFPVCIFS